MVKITQPKTARMFLRKSEQLLAERGAEYKGKGKEERSFEAIAVAFNAITGKDLTPAEVCLILQLLKDVRQWSNVRFHADSAEDAVTYAALKAEELYRQFHDETTDS